MTSNQSSKPKQSGFLQEGLIILGALIALSNGVSPTLVIAVFCALILAVALVPNKRETGKFFGGTAKYFAVPMVAVCLTLVVCVSFPSPALIFIFCPVVIAGSLLSFWLYGRSLTREYWQCVTLWHELGNTGRAPAAFRAGWADEARATLAARQ